MNIGKLMPVIALAAFAVNSAAFAQAPRIVKKAAAQSSRRDPYEAQNIAAMKKSAGDPAFRSALNGARAVEAKQILVRNGAYPKLVLFIEKKPTFAGSSSLPQFDLNGGSGPGPQWYCWKWEAVPHYFADGAFWYYTMACLGWATMSGSPEGFPINLTP